MGVTGWPEKTAVMVASPARLTVVAAALRSLTTAFPETRHRAKWQSGSGVATISCQAPAGTCQFPAVGWVVPFSAGETAMVRVRVSAVAAKVAVMAASPPRSLAVVAARVRSVTAASALAVQPVKCQPSAAVAEIGTT
ncbi:MAG: hypothetical protein BWZ02_03365 [Lentisphaerae bacterium ADurb.BinA184]|nr:MAG: hypothetical protein BWZ02_03365 [Lentisphaerae bacterium ADurb.BinA184]